MRSFWSQVPMLRIAFALMAGIGMEILADGFGISSNGLWIVGGALLLTIAALIIINNLSSITLAYKFRAYNGLALTILIISFGYMLTWLYTEKNYPTHFQNFLTKGDVFVAKINEPPVVRDKIIIAVAEITQVRDTKGTFSTSGTIQLNFLKDSLLDKLNYGDIILFKSKVDGVDAPKNPDEFNYKRYQAFQNIYHQTFLTRGSWQLIDSAQGSALFSFIYKIRDSFLQIIERYVTDKNDFGVASAIMLGYRDYVNADIMRAYASSGTIHVLSVSGLHVGIMFIMLNFLLQWMDGRGRKFVIAKAVIIILFIWFYACLTGLSPPVLRSAMMFSLIQLGKVLIRNVNMYNIIAASAILLMLFDPFVLADVGFQLSYLAVIGIVYLYPKISSLVTVKTPPEAHYKKQKNIFYKPIAFLRYDLLWFIPDWIWQLIAVSLAAQIATLPLCLFYFNQFPNLFLLSNLVVIPLSNLILFVGTALFAVGHISFLNDATGWVFKMLLKLLDGFIFWIDSLPLALTHGINLEIAEMVLMSVLILLVCWLTEEKKSKSLIASLLIVFTLCSFNAYKTTQNVVRKEIVVYCVPKQKAIAFISDEKVKYDFDASLWNNQKDMSFHVLHHWWHCGVKIEMSAHTIQSSVGKWVFFEGQKILIVDSTSANQWAINKKPKADLVILSGNPKMSLTSLEKIVDFDEVVFDASTKPWKRKSWATECKGLDIKFWDVYVQGAYIKDLK